MNVIPVGNLRNSFNSAVKNEKKKVLIQKLKSLGYLVESIANGSIELLESTGYELVNKGQSKGELGKPTEGGESNLALNNPVAKVNTNVATPCNCYIFVILCRENWDEEKLIDSLLFCQR